MTPRETEEEAISSSPNQTFDYFDGGVMEESGGKTGSMSFDEDSNTLI